jgi:hypothetical protein
VIWLFREQVRLECVPVFRRLQWRLAAQCRLWELLVIGPDIAVPRGLQSSPDQNGGFEARLRYDRGTVCDMIGLMLPV